MEISVQCRYCDDAPRVMDHTEEFECHNPEDHDRDDWLATCDDDDIEPFWAELNDPVTLDEAIQLCDAFESIPSHMQDELPAVLAYTENQYEELWEVDMSAMEDEFRGTWDSFEDYARDFAEDIGGRAIRDAEWPFTCIDWERAASELEYDYTVLELPNGQVAVFRD